MKKFMKIAALAMALVIILGTFASCGLSGKYEGKVTGTKSTTLEFEGDKIIVTATIYTLLGTKEVGPFEGTYEINDEKDKITLDFVDESEVEDEEIKTLLSLLDHDFNFEQDGDEITIGLWTFKKAK